MAYRGLVDVRADQSGAVVDLVVDIFMRPHYAARGTYYAFLASFFLASSSPVAMA